MMQRYLLLITFLGLVVVVGGCYAVHIGIQNADAVTSPAARAMDWFLHGKYSGDWAVEKAKRIMEIREENDWKNDLVLNSLLRIPKDWYNELPRIIQSWLRNWVGVTLVYFASSTTWCYFCYFVWGRELYEKVRLPGEFSIPKKSFWL